MKPFSVFSRTRETVRAEAASPPELLAAEAARKLEVSVLFTTPESTIAAVRRAATLLDGLEGRISLIDVQTVPYPLSFETPPVALDFSKQRLLAIAGKIELEIAIYVYLSRFRWETLAQVLRPGSVIVMGCPTNWWRGWWEKKLARRLQRAGHTIILVEHP
jgi:hypothetical protein